MIAVPTLCRRLGLRLEQQPQVLAIGIGGGYALRATNAGYVPASLPAEDPLQERFEAALQGLLDKGKEGATVTYESQPTGQGRIVLGHALVTGSGRSCLEFHRDETRGSSHSAADGLACQAADQSWSVMILPSAQ